ncbi:hypothetical protein FB451DRAFT_1267953 [Mycena latifolia]|nr:hypothetical protein FB451DRAFT_1267953 [Mycena latifolia]
MKTPLRFRLTLCWSRCREGLSALKRACALVRNNTLLPDAYRFSGDEIEVPDAAEEIMRWLGRAGSRPLSIILHYYNAPPCLPTRTSTGTPTRYNIWNLRCRIKIYRSWASIPGGSLSLGACASSGRWATMTPQCMFLPMYPYSTILDPATLILHFPHTSFRGCSSPHSMVI